MRIWRRSIHTFLAVRTQLPNILQLVLYWSCVWRRSGNQRYGSQSGGGDRGGVYWEGARKAGVETKEAG